MEQIFGRTATAAIGHPLDDTLTPEGRVQMKALLASAFAGNLETFEQTRSRADGSELAISATLAPILDGSGETRGS